MAKWSALGYAVHVTDGFGNVRDITNDVTGWTTGRSGVILHGVVNTAPGMSHAVFKEAGSPEDIPRTVAIKNPTRPEMPGFDGAVKFTDYQVTRKETGELVWTAPGECMTAWMLELVREQSGGDVQKAFGRS
jgi:hypothetical protein